MTSEARVETPSAQPLWLMGLFGFASGLPFQLSGFTLSQWLSEQGLSLGAIGLTAWIGLPYTLKFLWAPILDQTRAPAFRALGRRRGWLLLVQCALTAGCVGFAFGDPKDGTLALVAMVGLIAFASATQDILIDAWRIETYRDEAAQARAMAAYVWGYRIALLISGAGAIKSADWLGWRGALLAVACASLVGVVATLLAEEPRSGEAAAPQTRFAAMLRRSVVEPWHSFLARPRAGEILAFVLLFHLGGALADRIAVPFYRALGFDRATVAAVNFVPSLAAALTGAVAGAWLVRRVGVGRALIGTGFAHMLAMGLYVALALSGGDTRLLVAKVVAEGFAAAMADAAFITYLSGLCDAAFTATQYALLSSLAAIALRTVGGLSGYLAAWLGWVPFYSLTIVASLPAMLVMLHLLKVMPVAEQRATVARV